MKQLIKPHKLNPGDLVATVSLSSAMAGKIPGRYNYAKKQFEDTFGVKIIEMPNSLKTDELYNNPQLRLDDLMMAIKDPSIKAILTNIGGDDTVRLLRHMTDEHFEIIRNNPKIFLGMSDTTGNHLMFFHAGVSSFYSASLMFGYGENCGVPKIMVENTKKTLFDNSPIGELPQSDEFIVEKIYWDDKNDVLRKRTHTDGWHFIQGNKPVRGRLLGGCMELLAMTNGTKIWPKMDDWDGAILFVENSEIRAIPEQFGDFLHNIAAMGILENLSGILFGRPGGEFLACKESEQDKWLSLYPQFEKCLVKVCAEYGRSDMPIVTNMDFGHTVPQIILPYGALTEINPINKKVSILESAVL